MAAAPAIDVVTSSDVKHLDSIAKVLVAGALPGEIAGFSRDDRRAEIGRAHV